MNIPFISRILILCTIPGAVVSSCNPERQRAERSTFEERTPGGALGTNGTGADQPAPPEVRENPEAPKARND
jgi:hypothetical protein